jgi:hypothetical protein
VMINTVYTSLLRSGYKTLKERSLLKKRSLLIDKD